MTPANSTPQILIIEDEQAMRDLYTELLKAEGYQVDQAADGNQALTKLKQGGYRLVLLDLRLPQKNGLDILKDLSQNPPSQPNQNIILLTNTTDKAVFNQAKILGASQALIKSDITPDKVVQLARQFLGPSSTPSPSAPAPASASPSTPASTPTAATAPSATKGKKPVIKEDPRAKLRHDLRNKLTVIKTALSMINQGRLGSIPPKAQQSLNQAYTANEEALKLVEEIK